MEANSYIQDWTTIRGRACLPVFDATLTLWLIPGVACMGINQCLGDSAI